MKKTSGKKYAKKKRSGRKSRAYTTVEKKSARFRRRGFRDVSPKTRAFRCGVCFWVGVIFDVSKISVVALSRRRCPAANGLGAFDVYWWSSSREGCQTMGKCRRCGFRGGSRVVVDEVVKFLVGFAVDDLVYSGFCWNWWIRCSNDEIVIL